MQTSILSTEGYAVPPGYASIMKRGGARLVDLAYYYVLSFLVGIFFVIVVAIIDAITGSELVSVLQNRGPVGAEEYLFGFIALFG